MPSREVRIASSVGLHARPAAMFVAAVTEAGVPVTIAKEGGKQVNAASMLAVLSLGAKSGELVTLSSEAEGADAVLDSLVDLLSQDLDAQ